ncbi:MAG: hypothetical protein C0606_12260 [Hyphomicrobiales bacterium]|nr:MAG: hypothetical protein C0606_12260 [Hyphomicrobiales bacterium]
MRKIAKIAAGALLLAATAGPAFAQGQVHKLAIHVDQNDAGVMNLALNNAQNVKAFYESEGDTVEIEIVAYGPGLNMYVEGKSPVKDRISVMSLESPEITFSACGNTHAKMSKKAGKDIVLISEAKMTKSGVVRLMELQSQGYAYLRP